MGDWRVPGFIEIRELGVGGQGRAVLVREARSGSVAVLKYVAYAGDQKVLDQFRLESALLKRVNAPSVAQWFGHFEDRVDAAILMEAIDGVSLRAVLAEEGCLTPEAALTVLKGSLLGLAAAHAEGVVHRDYKPANVVVTADGHSKLIDFGISALTGSATNPSGTPAYMAPEQWGTHIATPATDVYAATCVFFECVTGHRPYEAGDRQDLRQAHTAAPLPLEAVDEALRPLLARGLAKVATDRPAGAAAFVTELEAVATAAYGGEWEERGLRAMAVLAAALAAVFPLAALMLATGGAGSGGAAVSGAASAGGGTAARSILGKLAGAKAAVAVGATAVGAAVVITVIVAPGKKPPVLRPAPVVVVSQSFAYRGMTLQLPRAWTTTALTGTSTTDDQIGISPANGCHVAGYWETGCTYVRIMGPKSMTYFYGDGTPYSTQVGGYFPTGGITYCPGTKLWMYGLNLPPGQPTWKVVKVGGRDARYWEFHVPCGPTMPTGNPADKPSSYFTQREWYLSQPQILLITNGTVPGWDAILNTARWT